MAISSRATLTAGLSLVGLACLVGPSLGQQADHDVKKANNTPGAAKPAGPATIGSLDLDAVFRGYEKVKVSSDAFKAEALQRQNELAKMMQEGKQATEMLAKLVPGQPDYKKMEARVSQLKANLQVGQEQAASEFAQKEAESLAALFKDIQRIVAAVAQQKGLTYVVRVSSEPVTGAEPQSVVAAMSRPVVYFDPAATTDITNDVITYLNHFYRQANQPAGAAPAPAAGTRPAAPPASPAPAPRSAPTNGNK
jgi:Skp family chaperone for outer membrane proteins